MRMKNLIILLLTLLTCSCCNKKNYLTDFPNGYTPEEIGIKLTKRFIESPHMIHQNVRIHYAEVCAWYGCLRFAGNIQNEDLLEQLQMRFEPFFSTESHWLPDMKHVDHNMFGSLPLELYQQTKDRRYYDMGLAYADQQWQLPKDATNEEKIFASKGLSWQTRMWIDDMFMITILQSQAYKVTGKEDYINRAAKEMVVYLDSLQRPNGLFYHAPDVPYFWGRGNGWVAVGMTELLRLLPENNIYRPRIMQGYQKMMNSLKKYQNSEGIWNQLVDDPACWTETSGSAMFTYALITGVKRGWLQADLFEPIVRKAWMKLVTYIDQNGDVLEVCIGTNKENNRQYYYDRPRITGDFHGQAPYLWCVAALTEKRNATKAE